MFKNISQRFLVGFLTCNFLGMFSSSVEASWILKQVRSGSIVKPIGVTPIQSSKELFPRRIKAIPKFLKEDGVPSSEMYEEILWPAKELPTNFLHFARSVQFQALRIEGSEVRILSEQGPEQNRICLTFLGDGYTEQEKEKFFQDVQRLADDLFQGQTFQSYRPLFNVYAVFVPSRESGITDLEKKDTAFGLFREPAGSKRGIEPGNPAAIEEALRLAPKTDFPILIANDEFYGGLGGQYAITTRSVESGKIVLRHELGHNFGDVGEEYDGGEVYSGANSSRSENVPWKHWLKEGQKKIVNDMRFLGGVYLWKNLSLGPVVQKFQFPSPGPAGPFWFDVQVSSVGWQSLSDVEIVLDGRPLELTGHATSDRSFFQTVRVQDLPAGEHTLEIREVKNDGDNVLAFADLYAYEADYDFSGATGAFKTYDSLGSVTFRPTHDDCIMRDMLFEFFCPVDQENMWIRFFNRVRLIDQVNVEQGKVHLSTMALPGLQIQWFEKVGSKVIEKLELRNQTSVPKEALGRGTFQVQVTFQTSEVRKPTEGFTDSREFQIQN